MGMSFTRDYDGTLMGHSAMIVNCTGDGSTKYVNLGLGVPLIGAIHMGCITDHVMVELNVSDGSTAANGYLFWNTAIGSGETTKYLVLY